MTAVRRLPLLVFLAAMALAAWVAATARYSADLSAFLPAAPTPAQALLVEQLREGPTARMILASLSGGDAAARAAVSKHMAATLRADARVRSVSNGDSGTGEADQRFVFDHRYLLSEQVAAGRFAGAGLATALADGVDLLGSSMGLAARDLWQRDPTGETLAVLEQYQRGAGGPRVLEGAWASRDGERALLVVDVRASGADLDAQSQAMAAIESAFAAARAADAGAAAVRLRMTGTGVFSVQARALIEREATRLSIASTVLIALFMLAVYRSGRVLLLGLLPVVSGALAGVAAVALGFSAVHGLTLGFGVTLIGEAVDYAIYLLVQSQREGGRRDEAGWLRAFWPTVRLGTLTSVIGFATLVPSGFPGLAQLGTYSIAGLACAALVTRFILPSLVPAQLKMADVRPLGRAFGALVAWLRPARLLLWIVPVAAVAGWMMARAPAWDANLNALNPVPAEAQRFDGATRADLGAGNVRTLVVVSAADEQRALEGAEDASAALVPLVQQGVVAGVTSPASYLPSVRTQRARQAALPDARTLRTALPAATRGLPFEPAALAGFADDVGAARAQAPVTRADLAGTALAAGVDALLVQGQGGWSAMLTLAMPDGADGIDLARVDAALAPLVARGTHAVVLDLKRETDGLYRSYLEGATRLSLAGFAAIVVLLAFVLRSAARVARVLAPLALAVAAVVAVHVLAGWPMGILHLVGLLLVVAIGSNYALFFDRPAHAGEDPARTIASLLVANLTTVMGFGVLAFSSVPILSAVGGTVAPGTFLALLFSALLARPAADHAHG